MALFLKACAALAFFFSSSTFKKESYLFVYHRSYKRFFSLLIMKKIFLVLILGLLVVVAGCYGGQKKLVSEDVFTIFKTNSCGCCAVYSQHASAQGLNVKVVPVDDIDAVKQPFGIPKSMQSCHTSTIGEYFVEGHVPVEAVEKLLNEKPDIKGIMLPGMPSGSPGMPGSKAGDLVIYALHKDGSTSEFMRL